MDRTQCTVVIQVLCLPIVEVFSLTVYDPSFTSVNYNICYKIISSGLSLYIYIRILQNDQCCVKTKIATNKISDLFKQ